MTFTGKRVALQNFIFVDDAHLNHIVEQIPTTAAVLENFRAKFSVSVKVAEAEFQPLPLREKSLVKRIRQLESYLERARLINKNRPHRMPHVLGSDSHYWWVKETFYARKVIIPTPVLLDKVGVVAITVWISDPVQSPRPRNNYDWTGSFLYLPTVHFEKGKTFTCISGCSALQFIVNIAEGNSLLTRNWNEPFGRYDGRHPVEKLTKLGAFVSDERKLTSLYYVRYITDEQVYARNGVEVRTNDLVGYPIYISSSSPLIPERGVSHAEIIGSAHS